YRDPDRIVALSTMWRTSGRHDTTSAPDFHDWHDQGSAFDAMAYYVAGETSVSAGSVAEYARVARVTAEFFRVFQLDPVVGRLFSEEEMKKGSAGAAVISYSYWQSHFGGDARALGQTIRLLGRTLTIAGVLPPRFQFPGRTDIWFPADTIVPSTTS